MSGYSLWHPDYIGNGTITEDWVENPDTHSGKCYITEIFSSDNHPDCLGNPDIMPPGMVPIPPAPGAP